MSKTVSIQLSGGLGNQLFQFATGLFVAGLTDRELEIDVSRISRDRTIKQRGDLGLVQRGILGLSLPAGKVKGGSFLRSHVSFNFLYRQFPTLLSGKFFDLSPNGETGIGAFFDAGNIQNSKSRKIILRGNMQFLDIALIVFKQFLSRPKFLDSPSELFNEFEVIVSNNKVLSIHFRFRDYVNLKDATRLPLSYYKEAISSAMHGNRFDQIWIFSDDIHSAKSLIEPLRLLPPITYHRETDLTDCETLILISLSHSIIAANSTFSLWACILSCGANKFVPSPWFKNKKGEQAANFVYPLDWNVIEW